MRTLTPAERRAFRAKAHPLRPVVSIGQHGLTPAVLHEIDVNLLAHELIKIRVFDEDRRERETLLARICDELDGAPVQHLGKILTVWRPKPEPADVAQVATRRARAPKPRENVSGTKPADARAAVRTRAKHAPRRGPSVIQGDDIARRPPRGSGAATGAKPAARRPPRPHGKSASSVAGASGARRRRKAR